MTEETQENPTLTGESAGQIDDDGSNPFWPKSSAEASDGGVVEGDGEPPAEHGGTPPETDEGATEVSLTSVEVAHNSADNAHVKVTVVTEPPGSSWMVDWGDGTATETVESDTLLYHTYIDTDAGQTYTITVTANGASETRIVEF